MPTFDKTIGAFHDSSNARIRKIGGYTGPTSYTTGGDVITPADLGMGRIEMMDLGVASNGTLYRTLVFIPNTTTGGGVIRWLDATNGTEIAAAANLSAYTTRFEAIGK
jgi:hypothetical protein